MPTINSEEKGTYKQIIDKIPLLYKEPAWPPGEDGTVLSMVNTYINTYTYMVLSMVLSMVLALRHTYIYVYLGIPVDLYFIHP